jgi:hypothetical protein
MTRKRIRNRARLRSSAGGLWARNWRSTSIRVVQIRVTGGRLGNWHEGFPHWRKYFRRALEDLRGAVSLRYMTRQSWTFTEADVLVSPAMGGL